eukprot:m.244454 g.244454  ORF g.244454 m.244454 type:complete len:706 (+) comp54462_c0_seq1:144-2261(+)
MSGESSGLSAVRGTSPLPHSRTDAVHTPPADITVTASPRAFLHPEADAGTLTITPRSTDAQSSSVVDAEDADPPADGVDAAPRLEHRALSAHDNAEAFQTSAGQADPFPKSAAHTTETASAVSHSSHALPGLLSTHSRSSLPSLKLSRSTEALSSTATASRPPKPVARPPLLGQFKRDPLESGRPSVSSHDGSERSVTSHSSRHSTQSGPHEHSRISELHQQPTQSSSLPQSPQSRRQRKPLTTFSTYPPLPNIGRQNTSVSSSDSEDGEPPSEPSLDRTLPLDEPNGEQEPIIRKQSNSKRQYVAANPVLASGGGDRGPASALTSLDVAVSTWNMNERDIPFDLGPLLLQQGQDSPSSDIYLVGTQEGTVARRNWEVKIQETLGEQYVLMHSRALYAIHLCVFIKRDLIWYMSKVDSASLATKLGGMLRTKGAVGITFTFGTTSFLVIDSHLTAHQAKVKERNADFANICAHLTIGGVPAQDASSSSSTVDVTDRFDRVIWLGDLNYRVNTNRRMADAVIAQKMYEVLLANDQLSKERAHKRVFNSFEEPPITFPPTFKFDVGSDTYDTSAKTRIPSWTDRILFKSKRPRAITCLSYTYVSELKISDHKAVRAHLNVVLEEGSHTTEAGLADFDREVYQRGTLRRRLKSVSDEILPAASATPTTAPVIEEEPTPSPPQPQFDPYHKPTMSATMAYKSSVVCTIL